MASRDEEFTDFFDVMLPKVLRVAYAMITDRGEAEDIAAEALARAYGSWARLRLLPYRERWVLRSALNLCIDLLRHRSANAHPTASLSGFDEAGSATSLRSRRWNEPASVAKLATDRHLVVVAVSRLPRRQRQAVALHYLADLPVHEVAEAMGCGEESVRTHLARAMRHMRSELGPDPGEVLDACS